MPIFDTRTRMPLRDALKVYWPWLSGVVVVPFIWAIGSAYTQYPKAVWGLVLLLGLLGAYWPWFGRNAPYSFWFVGVATFALSVVLATIFAVAVLGAS